MRAPARSSGRSDRAAPPDVQVARREVAQREHGEADVAVVALVHPVEVLGHRPFAAVDLRVLHGASEHLGPVRPRSTAAQDHREVDALRLDLTGSQREDAGIVRARQDDPGTGHGELLDRAAEPLGRRAARRVVRRPSHGGVDHRSGRGVKGGGPVPGRPVGSRRRPCRR